MSSHLARARQMNAAGDFRARFPWLLCNVASGILCAIVTAQYELLIQEIMVLAMFMTVVLALGESVSMQAMTMATRPVVGRVQVANPSSAPAAASRVGFNFKPPSRAPSVSSHPPSAIAQAGR